MKTKGVTVNHVRVTSHGGLLALVREHGGLSRQQMLEMTGMSRGTLVSRLEALTRLGYVYEAEALAPTGGRPARRVRFDDRGRVVLAADLGQTHARVAVLDLAGNELRSRSAEIRIADPGVLDAVLDTGAELLAAGRGERLVGVGVGVPSAVDPVTGRVVHPTTIPGWPPDAVLVAVRRRWAVPVVVENDARAGAVGESAGPGETLVYVKLSMGIGCGIVVGGEVLRGAAGLAGDIGHVRVGPQSGPRSGPQCRCGRRGCLAAYSSGRALLQRLGGTLTDLVTAAHRGDREVAAALAEAADVLGAALAATVTTVNPHRLVLGGALGPLPLVVDRVRARIHDTVAERARPQVTGGVLGPVATVTGLARLVVAAVYAPEAVDATVAEAAKDYSRNSP
ncbi:Sugar kinase of the NBD/HSP70 family, may contain an N-terminal HTH domain [Pseudonocardia thermophila]|uniref:Sugar kinase of the NBD/HSP70 family, may contain an N-terminal HTH domain n=1 Tax=Pseudonocardia thermophila TaxID=1848 RepID=A0A1M6PID1_PSETH|nr:Sugar kinase of the NBD/HSP70 family, may contain an N-terminal HTH domain [Pseudonocardia thermophila]